MVQTRIPDTDAGGQWVEDGQGNIVPRDGETVGDGSTSADHGSVSTEQLSTGSRGAGTVIHKLSGGTIVADGPSGEIASGTDASTIIQAAIDNLPSTGGHIYIESGQYDLSSTVVVEDKNNVHIEGSGPSFVGTGGVDDSISTGTELTSSSDIDLLEIYGNTQSVRGFLLENIHLDGQSASNTSAGVRMRGNTNVARFVNVESNRSRYGFYVESDSGAVPDAPQFIDCCGQQCGEGLILQGAHYAKVFGGEWSDNEAGNGIKIIGTSNWQALSCKLIGVTAVRNNGTNIVIREYTQDCSVTGGTDAAGSKNGDGISLWDSTGNICAGHYVGDVHAFNNAGGGITTKGVSNCTIAGAQASVHSRPFIPDEGQAYGLHIKSGSSGILVDSVQTWGNGTAGVQDDTGSATIGDTL